MSEPLRIVKVGGSLFDLPDLGSRLLAWLGTTRTLIVPGGGQAADAVRTLDRIHQLGDEAAHWLALRAMSLHAHFLARLLPAAPVLPRLPRPAELGCCFILDALPFFEDDDRRAGGLPHGWQVTSDSLAVRVAVRAAAVELVLLKSRSWPASDSWPKAVAAGMVDGFFPQAMAQAPELRVRIVNLRQPPGSIDE
jgi:5-(aminomethyl)-3-furanmethanol phosphate kinase